MNSGVDPLLLPKSQLAFAFNGTLRGDFFRQRPAYNTLNLSYYDSTTDTDFQTGLFQGAGYYKPDTGPESIALQIGGCQFLATPDNAGNAAVTEITIAGDPSSSSQPQAWICQAENFLIFNNGLELPVFFDGANSRRSLGASQALGTVSVDATVPAVGATVNLVLNDVYTGPFNEAIFVGSAIYIVTAMGGQSATSLLALKNLFDPATTHATGETLISQPYAIGEVTWTGSGNQFSINIGNFPASVKNGTEMRLSDPTVGSPPASGGISMIVTGIGGDANGPRTRATLRAFYTPPFSSQVILEPANSPNNLAARVGSWKATLFNAPPNVTVGTLVSGFTVPALGSTVNIGLVSGFVGSVGDIIWIGLGQYSVVSITNTIPTPNAQITVENISDTAGATITGGATNGTPLTTLPELPAGRALTYGMGRVWESMIDGVSFLAGDIVDGSGGAPMYNYRDSVLKITENTFLFEGGLFRVPGTAGDIKAMQFCALLDVSLGQGPLQVFTPNCVFSCQAPVDRTTWAKVTNPILTQSLIGAGGTNQNSVALANGDIIFRSSDALIRSLLMARLDFDRWSNTPISREMKRVLDQENTSLLAYSTAVVFDNRFLLGTGLTASNRGVFSSSLIALNFDPVSSLRGTDESVYDGQWSGLNVLQLVNGFFGGIARCFAICLSQDLTQIEIHEILPSDTPASSNFDDGSTPITDYLESPVLDFGDRKAAAHTYKRLAYGEIFVDSITGPVQFQAFYKPDQWPDWVPWYSWTQTYTPNTDPGFRPRVGLPMPDGTVFDTVNNRPLREGFNFQFKLVITGPCRFLGARFAAEVIPQPEFAAPVSP